MTIKITGTGIGLPRRSLTNDELVDLTGLETGDEWIRSRTGIASRYLCATETLADLAAAAAQNALDDAGVSADQVDYILCATIGADTRTPSLACTLAGWLGSTSPAVDLNGACAGFVYALDTAAALIGAGRAATVLIVCAEKMSAYVDWQDRRTCVLFGDGAAACVVTAGTMLRYINLRTAPDLDAIRLRNPMRGNNPLAPGGDERDFLYMDGQAVFKYAVSMLEQEVAQALARLNLSPEAIDFFLIHQANRRIIDFAISRLHQDPAKFPINIDRYGNMSAVTIPLLLHEMRQAGTIRPGCVLLLCAFGAGMTCGSCVLTWE